MAPSLGATDSVGRIEPLRPFFEAVEPELFDEIATEATERGRTDWDTITGPSTLH